MSSDAFVSGCGTCKPLSNYYTQMNGGDGNYSDDSLIPLSNGQDLYDETNYNRALDDDFINDNYDVNYKTSFGGASSRKKKGAKSSSSKKPKTSSKSKVSKKSSKKRMSGGFKDIVTDNVNVENDYSSYTSPGDSIRNDFVSSGNINLDNLSKMMDKFETMAEDDSFMMTGGKKSKQKKSKSKSTKKTTKKTTKKSGKKAQKGGMESSGATYMDGRFFDEKYVPSSCDNIDLQTDVTGMDVLKNGNTDLNSLHQYGGKGCSSCGNHVKKPSKKASKKTSKKTQKGGNERSDYSSYIESRFFNEDISNPVLDESDVSGFDTIKNGNVNINMLSAYGGAPKKSSSKKVSKKSSSKKQKKMSGGMESGGATYMDSSFFNPDTTMLDYGELPPSDMMTAYGPLESGNIGTGMLAPYTASDCDTANQASDMQTGGKPKKSAKKLSTKSAKASKKDKSPKKSVSKSTKSKKLRGGTLDKIDVNAVDKPVGFVNTAIDGLDKFFKDVKQDYDKFNNKIANMKFGNQRLVAQGGASKKGSKKVSKKGSKKVSKKSSKKHVGGDGSDFALTLNSRGPVNAPDDYWGVDGKVWFNQFNKTGEYIPNSQLKYAATPLLAGVDNGKNETVTGYDKMDMAFV